MKAYFIPGMGTTKEIYNTISLPTLECHYLDFHEPLATDSLKSYAAKMAEQIPENEEIYLIGMSMGGFLAQEIALVRNVKKLVLISSFRKGQSWQYFLDQIIKLQLLDKIPARAFKDSIVNLLKVAMYNKKSMQGFIKMAQKFSANYYKFSVLNLPRWKPVKVLCPIVQIHGDKDELFPIKGMQDVKIIKGGTHFMIATHSKQINNFLTKELVE